MVRPEYPRPNFRRDRWLNLNGEWEISFDGEPRFSGRITVPFCPQASLSGCGSVEVGDVLWYRRFFDAPKAGRLLLHFGAVDYRATVFVNGNEVARHEGGHTPFTADVTSISGHARNELVVRAEDPAADRTIPRGKQAWTPRPDSPFFYTPTSGIWQTVWLEPLPARHVDSLRLRPDLARGIVDVEVVGDLAGDPAVEVRYRGRLVGARKGSGEVRLAEVHPWSPESPAVYDVSVSAEGDRVSGYFGLRTIEVADGKVWLNGEIYVQRLVLDQGYFPAGLLTAPTDGELRRDIELAKAMGFNGARKHQKVEDPRWLWWADRLGFLAWGEMPNFRRHSEQAEMRLSREWEEAVVRDRDHPCVVAWAPINEGDGLGPDPARFLESLRARTKSLDTTRPVVSNDGWEHATTDLCTLHDYAPAGELASRYRTLEQALQAGARTRPAYLPGYSHRGTPVIVSEFGGIAIGGHQGFGYSRVANADELAATYRQMVEALMDAGPVEGFCYTQLTDVEDERNGLLTFDRRPKVDPAVLRPITRAAKRR